jgi:Coenzyme PQQ synthesis protein D (PqqD)
LEDNWMEALRLRVNAPEVIHETIDGEVIIINLASGNYYSVKGCGADMWDVIRQSNATPPQIVAAVAARFGNLAPEIETPVLRFLDELRNEGLIVDDEASGESSPAVSFAAPNGPASSRGFEPPVLEKYTDMQDLVLLDPVHEVGATGWPQPRPDVPANNAGT